MTEQMLEGFRHIAKAPVLTGLLQMEAAFAILSMNVVMITIIGRQVLNVGPEALGGLLSAPGLGSLIAIAFLLTLGQSTRQGRTVVVVTFAYAGALLAFAISRDYAISFAVLAVTGACEVLVVVSRNSIMQLATPGRMRGRAMANLRIVSRGLDELGQTQSGVLAGAIGGPLAVFAAAAVLAIGTAAMAWANPALWRFSREETALAHVSTARQPNLPES